MRELALPRPVATVATVVVRDSDFLFVEETTRAGVRLNQPAGHLEAGESLVDAAVRETLEETGYRVRPTALVGIYRWQAPETGATFIRFAFAADVVAPRAVAPARRGHPARVLADLRRSHGREDAAIAARWSCAASTISAPDAATRSIASPR